jgi:capsular exopolysaccharide synthesis family protein
MWRRKARAWTSRWKRCELFDDSGKVKPSVSRIYEALQRANPDLEQSIAGPSDSPEGLSQLVATLSGESAALDEARRFEIPTTPGARLVAWSHPNSLGAEKIRVLAARYKQAQQRRAAKSLVVTSAVRGDGKSTISLNLAVTFAIQGERTLLIDGDLHQPTLAGTLGVDGETGFANWCEKSGPCNAPFYRAENLPLWFLPAGKCEAQSLTLLQSPQAGTIMKQVTNWFSRIVIDSPPLVPLADSSVWINMSDAILLISRDGKTPKKALEKGLESIDKSKIFAVVMNDGKGLDERYYGNYYKKADSAPLYKAAAAHQL